MLIIHLNPFKHSKQDDIYPEQAMESNLGRPHNENYKVTDHAI